ncbi:3'-5' exonuclease, partial [Klebsiella quasipneumoniae]|uniref:3'-5' exonuclease n=1 Tax=Klebsiella quasipneumoniae TaxID=1463165 RepID=UPI00273122D5
ITAIIQEFNVTGLFPEDHNIKNLHLFLDQVAEFFTQISPDYTKNIAGLLSFLSDNEKNEEFRQASLENVDSLQLMTIHKAKGLEFDHVFL